jgi:hypothetical protein
MRFRRWVLDVLGKTSRPLRSGTVKETEGFGPGKIAFGYGEVKNFYWKIFLGRVAKLA